MVHRSMRDGSRVADELYIKRVLIALEDFLFFSLYSFSCIAKQVTTLKQFRFLSCLVLFSILHYCHQYHLRPTPPVTGAVLRHVYIIEVLPTFIGNTVNVDVASFQNERQQSVNNLGCCILYNPRTMLRHLPIINISAAFMRKRETDMVIAPL